MAMVIRSQEAHASSSSSSLITSHPCHSYDVFLSFRGEDTRRSFTDHLYAALKQAGIHTFRDDDEMERGKQLEPELKKAICESAISIIVFSTNYASSKWCLDEVLTIIEENERLSSKHEVIPVFYNIEPSDVRNQTGSFEKAFSRYDDIIEAESDQQKKIQWSEKVNAWRASLRKAGSLTGMVLANGKPARSGSTPTQEHSTVWNTLGKEKSQGVSEPLPDAAIREFCDKHYDQLLPLMAEKVHQEKLRQVQTRLGFDNDEEKSGRSREQSRNSESKSLGERKDKRRRQASPSVKSGPSEYSYSQSAFSRLSSGETKTSREDCERKMYPRSVVFSRLGEKRQDVKSRLGDRKADVFSRLKSKSRARRERRAEARRSRREAMYGNEGKPERKVDPRSVRIAKCLNENQNSKDAPELTGGELTDLHPLLRHRRKSWQCTPSNSWPRLPWHALQAQHEDKSPRNQLRHISGTADALAATNYYQQ
ncbi:NB-ARC domains-containing protein [Artemisia annua]|uniref:ADP-ribosyl cyclase/cyclic ADP-ribose hydrolase n=1 Tax=Artemisia annua TaxID=35608 RepID=A0A2U1LVQ3_ARTAN|nr:NB-ARC domains-containing protein [Artemisia annua]